MFSNHHLVCRIQSWLFGCADLPRSLSAPHPAAVWHRSAPIQSLDTAASGPKLRHVTGAGGQDPPWTLPLCFLFHGFTEHWAIKCQKIVFCCPSSSEKPKISNNCCTVETKESKGKPTLCNLVLLPSAGAEEWT